MASNIEDVSKLEKKITVEVPMQHVRDEFNRAYKSMQKSASIRGFRKGKAPLDTIRKMYAERVTPDVLNRLVDQSYREALNEHSVSPISFPDIDVNTFSEDQGLTFTAKVEVRPEVEIKKIEGLKIQREKLELPDSKIDEVLENIRQSRVAHEDILEDRAAKDGDVAVIDFDGKIDGEPLQGGQGTDHPLELGAGQFIPGFEEGVVGMKPGDQKDLTLTFPENYQAAEIAGKEVVFAVNLKKLQKKVVPELTDELVKEVSPHETLQALKDEIRKDLEKNEEKRIKDDLKDRLLKELVKNNPVDVPPSMLAKQKEALIDDLKQRMQQQGMGDGDFEEYKEKWDKDFSNTASIMIQSSFLISKLADEHDLNSTNADFEAKMEEYVQQTGIDMERIRGFYETDDQRQRLEFQLTEEKVVDFLISKAKVEEVAADKIKKDKDA